MSVRGISTKAQEAIQLELELQKREEGAFQSRKGRRERAKRLIARQKPKKGIAVELR
jgi:hypothetical protein